MKKGLLITCPEYDDATSYLTYFSKKILEASTNKSLKTKKIKDKDLNMKTFSQIIKKLDYRLTVFNGHGSPDSIFGYKNNVIIKFGKNDALLKERIVYARSCNAGIVLGSGCMRGTKQGSFIGYNLPFIFYMDKKWTTKPSNDKIAGLFLNPSNLIPISIIKGHTALEAHNNAKKGMLKIMKKLLKDKQEEETPFYLEALWNNHNGQVISGNTGAKL